MRRWVICLWVLLVLSPLYVLAQLPKADQDWNTSHTITSDAITVNCSAFVLPSDVGRPLSEPNASTTDTGEMSQSMRSTQPIKITLQPESGTSDTLSNINGCTVDAEIYLSTHDIGDTITIGFSGNIDPPGDSVTLDHPEDIVHLAYRNGVWRFVGGLGGSGGGGGCANLTECHLIDFEIFSTSEATPLRLSLNSDDYWDWYVDPSGIPTIRATVNGTDTHLDLMALSGNKIRFWSNLTGPFLELHGAAGTDHDKWLFTPGNEIILSKEVALHPIGDCTVATEAIVAGGTVEDWITCVDTTGDGFDFSYIITQKFDSDLQHFLHLWAINKTTGQTGNLQVSCQGNVVEAGAAEASHDATNAVSISWSLTTQNVRSRQNGIFQPIGTIANWTTIKGRCTLDQIPSEIANIRFKGTAIVQVEANSFSD